MTLNRLVILGAGHAGFALAAAMRQAGYGGSVTLVGDEPGLPYNRPPLSKAYLGGTDHEETLHFRPARFFEENRITLLAPERALRIDREAFEVELASGRSLPYDHLVLALGARNRSLAIPGSELTGIFSLRSAPDAAGLRAALAGARSAAVIGAGFVGLEFAATAAARGLAVTVLDAAPRAMSRVVSPETAAAIQRYHESLGTRFVFDARITGFEARDGTASPGDRVNAVRLANDTAVQADLVLVGIGAAPNGELAEACGLEVSNGIVVDNGYRTRDPAISAIGDCAHGPTTHGHARSHRLESVQNANDSARRLAQILTTGACEAGEPVPWFWSDQGKMKLQIAGLGGPNDDSVATGSDSAHMTMRFRRGRLVCVETINRAGDHMAARRLIASGIGPSLAEAQAGACDLKAALKAA